MMTPWFYHASIEHFYRISREKINSTVLKETVGIVKLRKFVVEQLTKIENGSEPFWWQNKELLAIFQSLSEIGEIVLPTDPVDRARWIALLCVAMAEVEGFSYGNVLIPADYLPEEMLTEQEERYGVGVIDDIRSFRNKLLKEGDAS